MANKAQTGKGGNFDTRNNPFGKLRVVGTAPSFTDVSDLATVLDAVCRSGCAVMLGHTRDGGALVFTVLDGDTRHRTYCSSDQELQDAVDALNAMYTEG